jgi:hypothetical protein
MRRLPKTGSERTFGKHYAPASIGLVVEKAAEQALAAVHDAAR